MEGGPPLRDRGGPDGLRVVPLALFLEHESHSEPSGDRSHEAVSHAEARIEDRVGGGFPVR